MSVAAVTGAASGLGRAIAHRLSREGNRVALWDVDPAGARRVAEEIGSNAVAFAVDVTDTASVRAGWSATKSSITIFCAAMARSLAVFTFMPLAGLRWHDAASTRSPSTSTMHARQLPSAR